MRQLNKLSPRAVETKKTPGRFGDGGGLYLQIARDGSRSWIFRFMLNGRAREMGLGATHTFSLAEAREKAHACRKSVKDGIDPIETRKADRASAKLEAARAMTFDACAETYISTHEAGWKNAKHVDQWKNTLATYASPTIGSLPVQSIDTALVLKVIEKLWHQKPETANRVRGRIESILDWAAVRGYRNRDNPARWRGHLDKSLPPPRKVKRAAKHPALSFEEAGSFVARLREQQGIAARALEFVILTAARTSEVLEAKACEFNLAAGVWTIPAERMKAGREHRVPLSLPAKAIASAMLKECGDGYVFPGAKDGSPLSNMAMLVLLQRRMGHEGLTVHGFRSTFRTWAAERTTFPREVAEAALAHVLEDKTEAAYQRGDLFEKRRKLMQSWANYVEAGESGRAVSSIRRVA